MNKPTEEKNRRSGALSRVLVLILAAACILGTASCGGAGKPDTTSEATGGTSADPGTQASDATSALPADSTAEDTTGAAASPEVPKSLKILAIGNSFSVDSMEYLWRLLRDCGVEKVILGNLYYGGCSMSQHLSFGQSDSASYTYYKNTSGSWSSRSLAKMSEAITDEEWDIITLQESSKTSGVASAYKVSFKKLVDLVRSKNSTATLVWNMTWAYQSDSTHSSFPNYDRDQAKMYSMIVDCVKTYVDAEDRISFVIPVGTAVQNARTSYLGDNLTRDGYHLNMQFGRYLAGLTWACAITGVSPDSVSYNPVPSAINSDMVAVAKESVRNALANKYEVTESAIKTGEGSLKQTSTTTDPTEVLHAEDFYEADKTAAAANGIDLEKYELLSWEYLENTYWNSTSKATTTTPSSTASTYHQNICTKKKFTTAEVPVGSVFICDSGWQYRLEKFESENAKYSGSRPGMITAPVFILTDEWLGGCGFVTWNVASNPKTDISSRYAQAAVRLRVYVPKG
ncbi:MAG: DUF4886 domain-containing protein [Clostridia bacterium]|nr:DUF4886 domain-containing protein [Clostridia bacterium]